MHTRKILLAWLLTSFVALGAVKPNILLLLVDDLRFSDIGCYGSEIETPNLDRLAANGTRFTQFYNTANCHSSRVSLLSGRWSHQAGDETLNHAVTIPEVLAPAGYFTAMTGKWHLSQQPTDFGFQRFFGHLFLSDNGACPYDRSNQGVDREPYLPDTQWTDSTGWAWARNSPFRYYKQNQFEGGIATPAIVHWPAGLKLKAGSLVHSPAHLVDVLPTLADDRTELHNLAAANPEIVTRMARQWQDMSLNVLRAPAKETKPVAETATNHTHREWSVYDRGTNTGTRAKAAGGKKSD